MEVVVVSTKRIKCHSKPMIKISLCGMQRSGYDGCANAFFCGFLWVQVQVRVRVRVRVGGWFRFTSLLF